MSQKVLSLVALPVAILIAVGLDTWLANLLTRAGQTFRFRTAALIVPIINLLYALLVMGLFWLISRLKDPRIGMVYLGTGLLLVLFVLFRWLGESPALSLPAAGVVSDFQRGFWLWGALLMAIGLRGILSNVNLGAWVKSEKSD